MECEYRVIEILKDLKNALKKDDPELRGEIEKIIRRYSPRKKRKRGDYEVHAGNSYYINEERAHVAYNVFEQIVNKNYNGLCITRINPGNFELARRLENTEFYWLSMIGKSGSLSPGDLPKILAVIKEFLKREERAVILIDGIEALITNNDFTKVLKFIQNIKDAISERRGILLIPIDLNTLNSRERAMFEKEIMNEIPSKKTI